MNKKIRNNHNIFHYLFTIVVTVVKSIIISSVWILLGAVGYLIFRTRRAPIDILVGLPLILIGAGFTINYLWSVMLVIFSPTYNRGVCKLCRR